MTVTLGQQYNIGEKPTVILYTYINRHAGTPEKQLLFKAVVKRKHPRIPAFQPFMKPVSYFLQNNSMRYNVCTNCEPPYAHKHPCSRRARTKLGGLLLKSAERCPSRCVRVKIHTRARRLKFLCLDMLCVAQIRRRKNQPLRLNHKLEEILHWTFTAPVVLGGVEIVYREGRILNLVQYSGD